MNARPALDYQLNSFGFVALLRFGFCFAAASEASS
jgi:hypothetical protein